MRPVTSRLDLHLAHYFWADPAQHFLLDTKTESVLEERRWRCVGVSGWSRGRSRSGGRSRRNH